MPRCRRLLGPGERNRSVAIRHSPDSGPVRGTDRRREKDEVKARIRCRGPAAKSSENGKCGSPGKGRKAVRLSAGTGHRNPARHRNFGRSRNPRNGIHGFGNSTERSFRSRTATRRFVTDGRISSPHTVVSDGSAENGKAMQSPSDPSDIFPTSPNHGDPTPPDRHFPLRPIQKLRPAAVPFSRKFPQDKPFARLSD